MEVLGIRTRWRSGESSWRSGESRWRSGELSWRSGESRWRSGELSQLMGHGIYKDTLDVHTFTGTAVLLEVDIKLEVWGIRMDSENIGIY